MEIWFDTSLQDGSTLSMDGECDSECQECSISPPPSAYFLFDENVLCREPWNLQQVTPLHRQEILPGRWLVCNPTHSGKLAVLDEHAYALFEEFQMTNTPSVVNNRSGMYSREGVAKAVALFYQLGFLCYADQPLPIHKEERGDTLSAWLHVTNACNLRCHYCYIDKTTEQMTDTIAKQSVDAVFRSATKQGFKRVKLRYAGGEASLYMQNVIELHDYAVQEAKGNNLTLSACVLSNGVVISRKAISSLKERNIGVMISLDGLGEYHDSQRTFINGRGSFKYVDRTISQLLAHRLSPHISVTVSRRNQAGLPELLTYIMEREMTFSLNFYRDNNCATHIADLQFEEKELVAALHAAFAVIERNLPRHSLLGSLLDKTNSRFLHHHNCGVGQSYLVIDQQGGVAKCHANIKQTVTTIFADDPLQVIKNDLTGVRSLSVDEKIGCRTCDWRYWCAGGCSMLTYRMTGRNDVKSPNCNIYKALFPVVLQLEALRILTYGTSVAL